MIFFSYLLLMVGVAEASPVKHTKEPRTVMVQLFEWPWNAVASECETVLGPGGFAAVQVSPPTEHISVPGHPWWERYQPVSHRLESRSGTEREFAQMVRRCRSVGVDVYVDVVLNHMAGFPQGLGFAQSGFTHYEYPGLFGFEDFHHCGRNGNDDIKNFFDVYELQNCELLDLADLRTESESVQTKLANLLRRLIGLGVAGFRVDAAKHMPARDISAIFAKVKVPFYAVHELIVSPGEPVAAEPYLATGDINVFPYAYGIGDAFLRGDLSGLPELSSRMGLKSTEAVVFLENHDLERRPAAESLLAYVKNPALHQLGLVFLLTYPYGYPQLYSGYQFKNYDEGPPVQGNGFTYFPTGARCAAPWTCSHRDPVTLALVRFRNLTNENFVVNDIARPKRGILAYGRGRLGHVVINVSAAPERLVVKTQLPAGMHCNLLAAKQCASVNAEGVLTVTVGARSAFVILSSL